MSWNNVLIVFMDDDKDLNPVPAPLPEEGNAPLPPPEEGTTPEVETPASEEMPA